MIETKKGKNVSHSKILDWLREVKGLKNPEALFKCIEELENMEYWVFIDESNERQKVCELSNVLNNNSFKSQNLVPSNDFGDFLKVLAYTNYGNSFRLLSLIHEKQPSLTGDLLITCRYGTIEDAKKETNLFMTRIKFLIKRECFHKFYSKEKRKLAIQIIQELDKNN